MKLPKMDAAAFSALLKELNACDEDRKWAQGKSLDEAFRTCHHADWMLWLLNKMSDKPGWLNRQQIVLLTCACVERALRYVPKGEDRPRLAIEAARRWANDPTEDNLEAARSAARAAFAAREAYETEARAAEAAVEAEARASKAAAYAGDVAYAADARAAKARAAKAAAERAAEASAACAAAYAAHAAVDAVERAAPYPQEAYAVQCASFAAYAAEAAYPEEARAAEHRAMCDMIRQEIERLGQSPGKGGGKK